MAQLSCDGPLLARLRSLLTAIEDSVDGQQLAAFYAADAIQVEYPSLVSPRGGVRGLDDMLEGFERGKRLLRAQHYEVQWAAETPDRVVAQLTWTATLATPLATLPAGAPLAASVAMFVTFSGDQIVRQESYDCYQPFSS